MSARLCTACRHFHGGRAFGVCLALHGGAVCPCNVVVEDLDREVDHWLRHWRESAAAGQCDGCGFDQVPVMRLERGPRVGMCEPCHEAFMEAWRRADAASEAVELATDDAMHMVAPEAVESAEPDLPARRRRAA